MDLLVREFAAMGAAQEALWVYDDIQSLTENDALAKAREIIARRQSGEPLAYILGRWEFRYLTLAVGPGVLIPRPETEGLVSLVLEYIANSKQRELSVADFGAGSGAIGLSLAEESRKELDVHLIENSADALPFLKKNLETLDPAPRARTKIFARDWSLFAEPVDIIVSNPPYIGLQEMSELDDGVKNFEPHVALFAKGDPCDEYRRIFASADKILKPGGAIFFEYGPAQAEQWPQLVPARYTWKSFKDLSGKERYLIAFDTPGGSRY